MDERMRMRSFALWLVLFFVSACALGQELGSYHEAGIWAGRSFHIFGSHEIRDSLGFFYGSAKPDRRLTHRSFQGHLVYTGYFEINADTGDREVLNPYQTGALGGLALMRWSHRGWLMDVGLGVQVQNHVGHDLPSIINTTPTLGIGWRARTGSRELIIGARYLHISNADTHRENAGQNQWLIYVSVLSF